MFVSKEFTFDSAHFLTKYYGKCERLHGHTYKLRVTLEGKVQSHGLVIDFVVLKRMVKKHVLDKLDHQLLNDVIENPSGERVVQWIWQQLRDLPKLLREELDDPNLGADIQKFFKDSEKSGKFDPMEFDKELRLYELQLWETASSSVTYRGE